MLALGFIGGYSGLGVQRLSLLRSRCGVVPTRSAVSAVTRGVGGDGARKKVVFLGTPDVAAVALQKLHKAGVEGSAFDVSAVVTRPPAPTGRKKLLKQSPVQLQAEQLAIDQIWTPISARNEDFLAELEDWAPDLCITAAYGNFLPQRFLDIPKYGTLNIHPSLLPLYRGAAPVPRALESGDLETGVSVAFTVYKMDSGPIVAQVRRALDGNEQAPQLLAELFDSGTDSLIQCLPALWGGTLASKDQDEASTCPAPKLTREEARLTFNENAVIVHNKVRALAGWPGTWADFVVGDEEFRVKVLETLVGRAEGGVALGVHEVRLDTSGKALRIVCDDGSAIDVLRVQPPGKKAMDARSFWNGLRGRPLLRKRVPH